MLTKPKPAAVRLVSVTEMLNNTSASSISKDRAGSDTRDSISDCRGRKSRRRFRGDIYCSQNLGQKWHKLSCVDEPPGQALLPRLTDPSGLCRREEC